MYQELQRNAFEWFKNRNKNNPDFTFSLRQKANKGAELNYFIGTEKSKYFSTTFWYIPVAYPGSSSDLINLVFSISKSKKIEFHFQFNQTKNPHDAQNKYALEFIQSIKPLFKNIFPIEYFAPDTNKMELFAGYSKPIYDNFEGLQIDLNYYLDIIIPLVNEQIVQFKKKYPDFIANSFSTEDQEKMFSKMKERFEKYKVIEELEEELEEEEDSIIIDPYSEFYIPLNQILYGPPGTGKTYYTINKAVRIANPEFNLDQNRAIVRNEYERLVEAGQIMFTTFHQSMSYEDFVEGIKPDIEEDADGVKTVIYEVKKGIFREIVENANKIAVQSKVTNAYNFEDAWNDLLGLGEEHINGEQFLMLPIQTSGMGLNIIAITDKGNLKVQPQSSKEAREYIVSFSRAKKLQAAFPDLSVIKNIDKEFRSVIGGSNSTAYWAVVKFINDKMKSQIQTTAQVEEQLTLPHVLIIDEINRGNVSQIFGELITLIEESKRLGKDESLEVTLPYSKEKFGVPSNLYLIGTMNTADRSVESLDTALRRRFSFEEMMPDLTVLEGKVIQEISLTELLYTINRRVEILLDRDHTIGHSYFMNIKSEDDLRNTFKNNIIPLLQEYFYGDYEKIGLILGNGFFDVTEKYNKEIFANFTTQNYPDSGHILRLKSIDESFDIIKALKILLKREQVIYE